MTKRAKLTALKCSGSNCHCINFEYLSSGIISRLIDLTNSGSVQQLLAGGDKADGSRVLATVLLLIREKLTKEKWKEYPIHKHALVWCIKHLKVILNISFV